MKAVTIQGPKEVRVDERPEPELQARDDAIVRIEAGAYKGKPVSFEMVGPWSHSLRSVPAAQTLLPIPQAELDVSPNMVQNPGY